jgi:hypothetical protein
MQIQIYIRNEPQGYRQPHQGNLHNYEYNNENSEIIYIQALYLYLVFFFSLRRLLYNIGFSLIRRKGFYTFAFLANERELSTRNLISVYSI